MSHDEERINFVCIVGLIGIAVILVLGILILQAMGKAVDNALIVMAGGITGALGGYVGAHTKRGSPSNVDASAANSVTVNQDEPGNH